MTDAQKRFCDEYLIDLNATRAYKVAYPNVKKQHTAESAGNRLLSNVEVRSYIQTKMKEREKRTEITQDMVLQELAKIGFFNIKNIYDTEGKLKQISDIDDDTSKAIASVKTLQRAGSMKININPDGIDKEVPIEHIPEQTVEIKINDKVKALELIGKHLGMFTDKVNVSGSIENKSVGSLLESINRQLGGKNGK